MYFSFGKHALIGLAKATGVQKLCSDRKQVLNWVIKDFGKEKYFKVPYTYKTSCTLRWLFEELKGYFNKTIAF